MVMLLPLIWQALKETEYRFRYPGVVLLWSFCLYATGYTPSLYSLGHAGLSRTLNAAKITYLLLLFLNEIYWCGWLQQRLQKMAGELERSRSVVVLCDYGSGIYHDLSGVTQSGRTLFGLWGL